MKGGHELMNIGNEIKIQRSKLSLSQDELGEKIFVTRQTISNWENGKSYPDLHSLILLSQTFGLTIDDLLKGDLKIMEKRIEQSDIARMKQSSLASIILTTIAGAAIILSWHFAFIPGFIIAALFTAVAVYFDIVVRKIKKLYDVQTYREIIAFKNGETLDEIAKARESGKRPYQFLIYHVVGMAATGALTYLAMLLLHFATK